MDEMVFTFKVTYSVGGTTHKIYICAPTTEAAKYKLLACQPNDNETDTIDILKVEAVYSDQDAKTYGEVYGTPVEFADFFVEED